MARKTDKADTVVFSSEISLSRDHVSALVEMCDDKTLNQHQVVEALALTCLTQLADGGMLLLASEMQRITDATGISPINGEELIPYLSASTGREEGKLKVSVLIDPAYEESYAEIAKMQDRDIEELFQEGMDMVLANEWAYEIPSERRPIHVLMPPQAKAELEEILGEPFSTGSDLAKLVKKALGGSAGLFDDDLTSSNVGQGVTA